MIKVVMNGWPATAASTFLSFRTCSTCFNLMTVLSLLSSCALPGNRHAAHTIDLLQNLQREYLVTVFGPRVCQTCQPDTREGACEQPWSTMMSGDRPGSACAQVSNIPVPSVFISSKSSTRSRCAESPSCLSCGSCAICSGGRGSCPTATS